MKCIHLCRATDDQLVKCSWKLTPAGAKCKSVHQPFLFCRKATSMCLQMCMEVWNWNQKLKNSKTSNPSLNSDLKALTEEKNFEQVVYKCKYILDFTDDQGFRIQEHKLFDSFLFPDPNLHFLLLNCIFSGILGGFQKFANSSPKLIFQGPSEGFLSVVSSERCRANRGGSCCCRAG